MAYLTREDGERFVIPSYREVLSAKQKSVLKRDILTLSQSYGEYITLQQKTPMQYEVAFSPDTGYLLGETVWHQFNRPQDMIYCEAVPGTTEAILVIVKGGSVYLDGSFPAESIPEELIIFLTQQNNFEIFIYGDVPISQTPQEGKFNFEPSSVKSFTVLESPIFATLPLLKIYRLQLVEPVLKAHGIGVLPIKQFIILVAGLFILWMAWSYFVKPAPEAEVVVTAPTANPYQPYYEALTTPAPEEEIKQFVSKINLLFTMPGWVPKTIVYEKGIMTAGVISGGSKVEALFQWANRNGLMVNIRKEGFYVAIGLNVKKRPRPSQIYPIKDVIANFTDRLSKQSILECMTLADFSNKTVYTQDDIEIKVENVTPVLFALIGQQLKDLPFALKKITVEVKNGSLSGSIVIQALGS